MQYIVSSSRRFPWASFRRLDQAVSSKKEAEPLREFVYLDEVSLASLLASQKGELTENITAQSTEGSLAEAGAKVGTNMPLLPSAEASSRFQTSNSSSLQTVRKANAQSLFREFHRLESLRRIKPTEVRTPAHSMSELFDTQYNGSIYKASDLLRGELVEFRVQLSASWIFQISTMIAEFSDMFDESPTLFMEHVKFADLYQAKNANRIVSRLLAGLVPVNGLVPNYSVIEHDGAEYIAHKDAISELGLATKPLQVVGVTEHLAYWKDIRRILFAENEFTVLCRLSKPGIQHTWNPIKLADIFKEFAPDLANQIEQSSRMAIAQSLQDSTEDVLEPNLVQFMIALVKYKALMLGSLPRPISRKKSHEIDTRMSKLSVNGASPEGQRAAFAHVKAIIHDVTKTEIDAETDLSARRQVRELFDLPLFPRIADKRTEVGISQAPAVQEASLRLLDVEVIAIYW